MSNNDHWIKGGICDPLRPNFVRTVNTPEELNAAIKEADQFIISRYRNEGNVDGWRKTGLLDGLERDSWEETMTACAMEMQRVMKEC